MDSLNEIATPEVNEGSQSDQPEKIITFMDAALYEAAAGGRFAEFENYERSELGSLKTPDGNTVLHVYSEAKYTFDVLETHDNNLASSLLIGILIKRLSLLPKFLIEYPSDGALDSGSSFITQILNKCPSLLLEGNAKDQIPLHFAAMYGQSEIAKFLINHAKAPRADLEQPSMDNLAAVREMLRKTDMKSNTALHVAAKSGHVGVVQELLKFEDPLFSYSVNANQETPVYLAARKGNSLLLTTLLDKFKSTAHGSGPFGRTILHAAAMSGDAGATRTILEKVTGNLTKERDENGHTPLHYAAHLGHYSVVTELLKRDKAAAYIADKKWELTPLLMAARQGNLRIVRQILSCCPDCCEMVDKRGWNLLHFVALKHSPFRFVRVYPGNKYRSMRKLLNWKDACGITARQVDAIISNKEDQSAKLEEQVAKMLEDILTEEEVAEAAVVPIDKSNNAALDSIEKARDAHLVVAALMVTVTFAAAITIPGGLNSEKGSDQGTALLIHDAAFVTFYVSNASAFVLSLGAIFLHLQMSPPFSSTRRAIFYLQLAAGIIFYAICAMVIAFIAGSYTVLKPSRVLAFSTIFIFPVVICLTKLRSCLNTYESRSNTRLRAYWDTSPFSPFSEKLGWGSSPSREELRLPYPHHYNVIVSRIPTPLRKCFRLDFDEEF